MRDRFCFPQRPTFPPPFHVGTMKQTWFQEFVTIARLRLQMRKIGVPPNAELQAIAEGKDPKRAYDEVCLFVRIDSWLCYIRCNILRCESPAEVSTSGLVLQVEGPSERDTREQS